jgi:hypothetical protein
VLIQDSSADRLPGHRKNVPPQAEDYRDGQAPDDMGDELDREACDLRGEHSAEHDGKAGEADERGRPAAAAKDQERDGEQTETDSRGDEDGPLALTLEQEGNRREAEADRDQETATLADQVALLVLEGADLARIPDRVADLPKPGSTDGPRSRTI